MIVNAPLSGKIIALSDVPDEAFAQKMLGDGLAIESNEEKEVVIKAPLTGTIAVLNNNLHAIVIEGENGLEVLLHIGVDTVALKGKGFKSYIKEGQKVKAGDKLIKVDLRFIRKNAPASMVMVLVTNMPDQAIQATTKGTITEGEFLFSIEKETPLTVGGQETGELQASEWITIINPNGLHARPAANFSKQALTSTGRVELEKFEGKKVDAKSSTGVMSLDLAKGSKARIWAADAKTLNALVQYLELGAGEDLNASVVAKAVVPKKGEQDRVIDFSKEERININLASPGVAKGRIFVLNHSEREVDEVSNLSVADEKELLKTALEKATHAIRIDLGTADNEAKAILEAHLSFVEDEGLKSKAEEFLALGKTSAYAWQQVTNKMAKELASSSNQYMVARAIDMRDVGRRVLDMMLGEEEAPNYPPNSVVVATELAPSDITKFTYNVVAAVTIEGSSTGHAAIMLRNSGVPSLYGAPRVLLQAMDGLKMIVDSDKNLLITNPSVETLTAYDEKISTIRNKKAEAFSQAQQEGATKDGHRVEVSGNVSSVQEGIKATEQGGEGYGLARSEFLFYGRQTAPTEEEQIKTYQGLLDATRYEVTVRLLDAGGDKPIVYVNGPKEDNPLLGIRGMRIYDENEELYRTQFRALLRCKPLNRLKIMVPMIALVSEVELMRTVLKEEMEKLGIPEGEGPKFGIMAETPSVCAMAEQFAKRVDFFSVGTNDLSQYTMAMDRTSSRLANLSKASTPSILNLVYQLCQGAKKYKVPVAVCGAAASDPVTAALFVGLGVEELAVSGAEIPEIKALIRKFTLAEFQEAALETLKMDSAEEVIAFTKKRFNLE